MKTLHFRQTERRTIPYVWEDEASGLTVYLDLEAERDPGEPRTHDYPGSGPSIEIGSAVATRVTSETEDWVPVKKAAEIYGKWFMKALDADAELYERVIEWCERA